MKKMIVFILMFFATQEIINYVKRQYFFYQVEKSSREVQQEIKKTFPVDTTSPEVRDKKYDEEFQTVLKNLKENK